MMAEKTRFDNIFLKIKNNPVLAIIIALGAIVIALSTFTNAARNLMDLFSNQSAVVTGTESANVGGTWKTQELSSQFNKNQKFTFSFEFDAKDTILFGTITLTPIGDNRSYKKGIRGGKIEGNIISFYTQETTWMGSEKHVYKDLFHGTVSNDEIEFIQSSDRPWEFVPQKFIAIKEK
jgi:hypothetical protein